MEQIFATIERGCLEDREANAPRQAHRYKFCSAYWKGTFAYARPRV